MPIYPQAQPADSNSVADRPWPLILHDLPGLVQHQDRVDWQPFHPGVDIHWLYRHDLHGAAAALIRFQPGGHVPLHEHRGYEHIFVLSGSQSDQNGRLPAGSLMIHPPGTCHQIASEEGCLVLAIYEQRAQFVPPEAGHAP